MGEDTILGLASLLRQFIPNADFHFGWTTDVNNNKIHILRVEYPKHNGKVVIFLNQTFFALETRDRFHLDPATFELDDPRVIYAVVRSTLRRLKKAMPSFEEIKEVLESPYIY